MTQRRTLYEAVGGEATFYALVEAFYRKVQDDPELRPMYPPDLTAPRDHLALFLIQYFGGPGTYSQMRGHPRLRMRHVPFVIGERERHAWFRHMSEAVDEVAIEEPYRSDMLRYFSDAATFLINQRPS